MPYVFFQKWLKNGKLWKKGKHPIKRFSKTLNKVTFPKKYLFRKMSLHKLFQSKLLICTQNQKKIWVSFIWKLRAKHFQNTLDSHYDQRIWVRNDFANLDNAVYLPPKNALFATLLDIHSFLTMKKWKHCFRWPTPLEWYDWDNFIEPGLGVSTNLDCGPRLFSTQWPPYGAHILQGLITRWEGRDGHETSYL